MGVNLRIDAAPHPTNVIWDAQGIRMGMPKWIKTILSILIGTVAVLAYVSFLIWLTQSKIEIDYVNNPPGIDCEGKGTGKSLEN